ncbi:YjcQ family protein [Paucisalibacillus globulus]|uniref:YjcQ family protein n=1 Tax=Paucisalibacillus globulus TaxID=351095 RepID=UPI001596A32A|nr:YjcQ family protein [Paucisalibacillus globulus]
MNRKKIIYSILKEIDKGNEPKKEDYELEMEQWGEIASLIKNEGYATGINVLYADDNVYLVIYSSPKLTIKGIDFLEENSGWAKTYKGLKEVRDWIKP